MMTSQTFPLPSPHTAGDDPKNLRTAETWVFDLDNTLYPASTNLFGQIDVRMKEFIADFLGVKVDEAYRIQKQYFKQYGTTLNGLMTRHGMKPDGYLDFVHDIDVSAIAANPQLDAALGALPGRKVIFTNASTGHADRVMGQLGIARHFDGVFDIYAADFVPKPAPSVYDKLLAEHSINPQTAVMVEDMARNLKPAADLGMATVWVRTTNDWGHDGAADGHIDHWTDDLAGWLHQLTH